jgi:uncharacterized DUF497 family protein
MVDLTAVEHFEWDDGNARRSADKHGVSQLEAEQVFLNDPLLNSPDIVHSGQEQRFQALSRSTDGRRLFLSFTLREGGRALRVISVRDMSRKERRQYEPET